MCQLMSNISLSVYFVCPFTGSQSVHPAVPADHPEDAPYLLLEDLHHNRTHSSKQSVPQSSIRSAKQTLSDSHSPVGPGAGRETDMQIQSDLLPDTHTESATNTAVLVQLQHVSAVQAANTERYEAELSSSCSHESHSSLLILMLLCGFLTYNEQYLNIHYINIHPNSFNVLSA